MRTYGLYKGGVCLAEGTIKAIALNMDLKENTIYKYNSNQYKEKNYGRDVMRLEVVEENFGVNNSCKECGSKRMNEVMSDSDAGGWNYFCMNCLTEFDNKGNKLEPIL